MRALLGTIVCKFGSDPATSVVEEAICAKFTDRQTDGRTDGRRTPRDCISSWNELIKTSSLKMQDLTLTDQKIRGLTLQDLTMVDKLQALVMLVVLVDRLLRS